MVDRGLVGFGPGSALQPWYFLPQEQVFSVRDRWPKATEDVNLVAFARRQDCDDIACFDATEGDVTIARVVVVHGWTPEGYAIAAKYETIWAWLGDVVADIEAWVALGEE